MSGATKLALVVGAAGVTGLALYVYAGAHDTEMLAPPTHAPPVVASAPPSHATTPPVPVPVEPESGARRARQQLVERIRDPSHGHEPWDEPGLALLTAIGGDAIATTDVGCYMAGCMATFTFRNLAAYRAAAGKLEASPGYKAWTGGKQLTEPETLGDDSVVVALVLQRPD